MLVLLLNTLMEPAQAQAANGLADGTYTADYLVLKAEDDSVSMANDYWEKPATVTFSGGKASIRLTINHSAWVTEFKVASGGGYADTRVVSSSKSKDTRLVEFGSEDISKPIMSKIHVTVEEIDYDHDYTIRIVFKEDSFKLIKGAEAAASPGKQATGETASTAESSRRPAVENTAEASPKTDTGKSAATAAASGQPATDKPAEAAEPSGQTEAGKVDAASAKATAKAAAEAASTPAPANGEEFANSTNSSSSVKAEASASAEPGYSSLAASSGNNNEENHYGSEEGPTLAGGTEAAAEEQASSDEAVVDGGAESSPVSDSGDDSGLTAAAAPAPAIEEQSASGYALLWWLLPAAILIAILAVLYIRRIKKRQVE